MIALLGRFLMRFSGRTGIGSRCDTEHRSCPLMDHDEQARRPPPLSTRLPPPRREQRPRSPAS